MIAVLEAIHAWALEAWRHPLKTGGGFQGEAHIRAFSLLDGVLTGKRLRDVDGSITIWQATLLWLLTLTATRVRRSDEQAASLELGLDVVGIELTLHWYGGLP